MRLILVNSIVWLCLHIVISRSLMHLPRSVFSPYHPSEAFFKARPFEQAGKFWRVHFYIHVWKSFFVETGSLLYVSEDKKSFHTKRLDTVKEFIEESKRLELIHWVLLIPAPYFFLWNPTWVGWAMVSYSLLINVPFIMIQRYNRVRLSTLQIRMEKMIKKGAVYR